MDYSPLRYRPEFEEPSPLFQLEGKARTALGLSLQERHRPALGAKLQPVRMKIQLDPGLMKGDQKEIGRINGYFMALTAKSLKHVEIPFRPNTEWVPLTSDVEIQVYKAEHKDSTAHFDIRQHGQSGSHAMRLQAGDPLSSGIVVDRQFIGDKPMPIDRMSLYRSSHLPAMVGGQGTVGYQTEAIDYLIAVDPAHRKIPFELKHIPLPEP
jgi:hypothetical protein